MIDFSAHPFSLKQLRYFAALAEGGSFNQAAARCHVTQSTFSAGLQDLEAALGQALFDRSISPARLTAFGRECLPAVQEILSKAGALQAMAVAARDPEGGVLRLGVIPTIAPYLLPDLLPAIWRTMPKLDVRIKEAMTHVLIEDLKAGEVDVALIATPYDLEGFAVKPWFEEGFIVVAPEKAAPPGKTIKVEALEEEKLLLLEEGHCLRDHALEACRLRRTAETKPYSATSLQTLLEMVRAGYGVTLLPEMMVKSGAVREEGLRFYKLTDAPGRGIAFVWRQESAVREKVARVVEGVLN